MQPNPSVTVTNSGHTEDTHGSSAVTNNTQKCGPINRGRIVAMISGFCGRVIEVKQN